MNHDLNLLATDLIAAAEPFFAGTNAGSIGVALHADRATAARIAADGSAQLIAGAIELVDTAGMLASLWLGEALPAAHRRALGRAIAKGTATLHVFVYRHNTLVLMVEADGHLREIARRVVAELSRTALH